MPCTPKAPTTWPMASSVDASPSRRGAALLRGRFGLACDFGLATLDELLHGIRRLRALADPMRDAVERDAVFGLVLGGLGIVEADALDEAPVARHARVGDDDVVEGAVLGSATRHSDHDQFMAPFPLKTGNRCDEFGEPVILRQKRPRGYSPEARALVRR